MEKSHSLLAVLTAASFLVFCCDQVSSSRSLALSHPNDLQCTWLYQANPNDCNSYYQCLHGRPLLKRCPRTLHWNAEGHFCEHEYRSACKAKGKDKTGTLAGKECQLGTFAADPQNCNNYYQCDVTTSSPQFKLKTCGALHWNPIISACDWPSSAKCHASSYSPGGDTVAEVTTSAPITTSSSTTTTQASLPDFYSSTTPRPTLPTTFPTRPTTTSPWTTTTKVPTWPTTSNPTPRPTTMAPSASETIYPILNPPSANEYKVVCYFTNWAVYRRGDGQYTPAHIDPRKCTHIIYAFGCLNAETYKMGMCDPWIDGPEGKNFYAQITALKKFGVKPMIAVGGWNDSAYTKWTTMLKDHIKMGTFIKSVCDFLEEYGFVGIDLDYEYPACPQANCNYDSAFEKAAFVNLIRGLRLMCPPKIIISTAVSCSPSIMPQSYDVPMMNKYVDFINMMAYDFHGSWEPTTGINAPYQRVAPDVEAFNVVSAVKAWKRAGADPSKLVLGIPTYGQTYTLANPLENGIGAKAVGPGPAAPYTNQKGMMSTSEICMEKWSKDQSFNDTQSGAYHVNMTDGKWVSHDDRWSICRKMKFVRDEGCGGAMIWALDLDDFLGKCPGGKPYPVLEAINECLGRMPPRTATTTVRKMEGKTSLSKRKLSSSSTKNRKSRTAIASQSRNRIAVRSSNNLRRLRSNRRRH